MIGEAKNDFLDADYHVAIKQAAMVDRCICVPSLG